MNKRSKKQDERKEEKMRKNVWKRCLAFVLSAVVMFTSVDMSAFAAMNSDGTWSNTAAALVAEKYYGGTDAETVLKSVAIKQGTSFEGQSPLLNEDEALAVVDNTATGAVVYANTYADGNYTWVPVKATVMVESTSQGDADFTTENNTYENNSYGYKAFVALSGLEAGYSVVVDYEVRGTISASEQESLLQIPADLADGVANLEALKGEEASLAKISNLIKDLDEYKEIVVEVPIPETDLTTPKPLFDDDGKNAIADLCAELSEDDKIELEALVNQYTKRTNATKMLVKHGTDLKTSSESTNAKLNALLTDARLEEIAELCAETDDTQAQLVGTILEDLIDAITDVNTMLEGLNDWSYLESVKTAISDLSAVDFERAIYNLRNGVSVPPVESEQFVLMTCAVSRSVGTIDVKVKVTGQAVSKETNVKEDLVKYETTLSALSEDVTKDQLKGKTGAYEETVIGRWNATNKFFKVDQTNYERTDSYENGIYTITYSPKNVTVNEWGTETTYPYGTELTLESHDNDGQAWDYTVVSATYPEGKYYYEGSTLDVTEELTITRVVGAVKEDVRLYDAVAAYHADALAGGADVLEDTTLKSDSLFVRKPTEEAVGEVEADGSGWKVKVTPTVWSGEGDKYWTPVVTVEGGSPETPAVDSEGYARWTGGSTVNVEYKLDLGLDSNTVKYVVELPQQLQNEMNAQKALLQTEGGSKENVTIPYIYNLFKEVYTDQDVTDALANLDLLVNNMATPEGNEAVLWLSTAENTTVSYKGNTVRGGWEPNGTKFAIDKYLEQMYLAGWNLATYYKTGCWEEIQFHAEKLSECLTALTEDQKFLDLLGERVAQLDKIKVLAAGLGTMADKMCGPNEAIDLTVSDATFATFVDTVLNASIPAFSGAYEAYLTCEFERVTPDQATVKAIIKVGEKEFKSDTTLTYTIEPGQTSVTLNDTQAIEAMIAALDATVGLTDVEKANYYTKTDYTIPTTLNQGVNTIEYSYLPNEYTVKVQGAADQTFEYNKAEGAMAIELPASPNTNTIYYYLVKGEEIEVTNAAKSVPFSVAELGLFDANREYVITLREVDRSKQMLEDLIEGLNSGMGSDETMRFALVDDSMVISIDSSNGTDVDFMGIATALGMNFALGNYKYVGFGELGRDLETAFKFKHTDGSTKLDMQPLVSFLLTSGLSSDSVVNGLTTVARANTIDRIEGLGYGEVLGASYIQLGDDAATARNMKLYLAFSDLAILEKVQKYVAKAKEYGFTFVMEGGKLNVSANLPDKAYQIYLSALLVLGLVDIENIEDVELKEIVHHHQTVLKPVLTDENTNTQVIENTFEKLGYKVDLSAYADRIDNQVLPEIRKIIAGTSKYVVKIEEDDASIEEAYAFTVTGDFGEALDKVNNDMVNNVKPMLVDTDVYVPVEITFENIKEENAYEALVLDLKADGVKNKFFYTKDLEADIDNVTGDSIVVLLKDIDGDIVFGQDTLLNLNGKTIIGNVTANKALTIVDSYLDNGIGGVTGTVSGTDVDVTAGKYSNLDSAMVADGYKISNGVVVNKYYTVTTDANGNVTVTIATDYVDIEETDAKSLALDIATEVLFDWFTNAAVSMDGNVIYDVNIKNILDKVTTKDFGTLATELSECISEEGVTDFANILIADLEDFGALADAAEGKNGGVIATYNMTTSVWNVVAKTTAANGHIDADITSGKSTDRTITVKFDKADDMLKELFENLDGIVDSKTEVALVDFIYKDGKFNIDGSATTDVTVDLTKYDTTYGQDVVVIMSVILAHGLGEDADGDFAKAIQKYINDPYDNADLKKEYDKLTLKKITEAARAARGKDFSDMADALGLTLGVETVALEAKFGSVLKVMYAIIDKLDIENDKKKLGSLYTGDYAEYEKQVNRVFDKVFNKAGFEWNVKFTADNVDAKLILFKEKPTTPPGPGGNQPGGNGGGSGSSDKDDKDDPDYEGTYYPTQPGTPGANTGDANNTTLWIALMGLAIVAVVVAYTMKKRKAE